MERADSSARPVTRPASLIDYLLTLPQYLLPQHLLSRLMHRLTRSRLRAWKDFQIQCFIRHYKVDMSIAAQTDPRIYSDFNSFFTRALKADARPITGSADDIVCPVDGVVSQIGNIREGIIFQAKGHDYSLEELLGGSKERAAPFNNGRFATLYLSPKDYHRIHMPLTGILQEMVYVPGRLFSVNSRTTRAVPNLFARNERVITMFETPAGPLALVLVGALFVASIETVWAGAVTPPFGQSIRHWDYGKGPASPVSLERGQEMGRFNMGSTVILLLSEGVDWHPLIKPEAPVRMNQSLLAHLRVGNVA